MTTDWVCAFVPFFIVANLQMSRRKKVSVICILGLGVFASIATCVRIPYAKYYDTKKYPTETACKWHSTPRTSKLPPPPPNRTSVRSLSADQDDTAQFTLGPSCSHQTLSAVSV